MLQETAAAAPAAAGGNNAAALQQMGFESLIQNFDAVGWIVFLTLSIMSVMSWYWIIINFIKNMRLRGRADRVVTTFWETTNAQDAIRYMEEQSKSEPFSKIALDAAQAAAPSITTLWPASVLPTKHILSSHFDVTFIGFPCVITIGAAARQTPKCRLHRYKDSGRE